MEDRDAQSQNPHVESPFGPAYNLGVLVPLTQPSVFLLAPHFLAPLLILLIASPLSSWPFSP